MSKFSAGAIVILKGMSTGEKYREILADQVHSMIRTLFLTGDGVFQDDNAPIYAAGLVQVWFDEYEAKVKHLPWPHRVTELQKNLTAMVYFRAFNTESIFSTGISPRTFTISLRRMVQYSSKHYSAVV
ncbi:DDE_3 domain-containing protein [Trichonephila clavipes]|nr:DDE_3 domain-containing protein [Trichonephila clavipes]